MTLLDANQEHFIRSLLAGKREISNGEVLIRQKKLGLEQLTAPYMVADISPYYTSVDFRCKDDLICNYKCFIEQEFAKDGYNGCVISDVFNNFIIVLSLTQSTNSDIDGYFIELHDKLFLKFGQELFIGIGRIVPNLKDINESADDAMEMLGYKFQYAERGVINVANIVPFRRSSIFGPNIVFERVIGCFEDGDLGRMSVRLDELIEYIRHKPNVSKTSIRRTMIELIIRILNTASNADIEVEDVLGGRDPYTWILQQNHTEIIVEWIMQISSELICRMKKHQEREVKSTVQNACVYILNHLNSQDLGLQTVSESVGLSSSYFSQLFKDEMNIGISAYITELRITRAKTLLSETELTNEMIALQLGFSSVNYFIRVFNKSVGMSPGQYRKKEKAGGT